MTEIPGTLPSPAAVRLAPFAPPAHRQFCLATAALILAFIIPLIALVRLALANDLYSHVVLVPFITLYLVWIKRAELTAHTPTDRKLAAWFLGLGLLGIASYGLRMLLGPPLPQEDGLAWLILSFLLFFGSICSWFYDRATLRALTFPLVFLVFLAPFPTFIHRGLETFLQHTSAWAAYTMIKLAGTPILREGLIFHLPGISLEVAPQCSGIRSTVALFITSLLAGYFFLRSPWKRTVLTLFVIPLAILRNGFRIFTIAQLCVHVSPDMIHSYIHRQGGPIFFLLSLVPFFFLLRYFYKSDRVTPTLKSAPKG